MSFDEFRRDAVGSQTTVPTTQTVTFAAALAVNFDSGKVATCTLTNNLSSLTLSGGVAGTIYCLRLAQDTSGSRTLSSPDSAIKWQGTTLYGATHTAPTLTATASKVDVFYFMYDGASYQEVMRSMSN